MTKFSVEVTADQFELDPLFGEACEAYQLQIPLGDVAAIIGLQRALVSSKTEAYHVLPQTSLHVTILPLINVTDEFVKPKGEYWQAHSAKWCQAISRICSMTAPFQMRFSEARYDRRAVVALAEQNPASFLRTAVAETCSFPTRTVRVPSITHVTLARYRDPDRVQVASANDMGQVACDVHELRLIREARYPTLEYEVLDTFRLTGERNAHSA